MTFHEHQHDPRQRGAGAVPARAGPGGVGSGSEERPSAEQRAEIKAWFTGRLPDDFFVGVPEVDRRQRRDPRRRPAERSRAGRGRERRGCRHREEARIERFREDTREHRIRIAEEAQARFGRVVSWGATAGSTTRLFTIANVPVMTRLRMSQRQVLDTLIDAGIARSRSEALAWCVELVGRNEAAWIDELRKRSPTSKR